MKPVDLKDIVIGLMMIIFIAMSFGQYSKLQKFARAEAAKAMRPWPAHKFFPQSYVEKSFKDNGVNE